MPAPARLPGVAAWPRVVLPDWCTRARCPGAVRGRRTLRTDRPFSVSNPRRIPLQLRQRLDERCLGRPGDSPDARPGVEPTLRRLVPRHPRTARMSRSLSTVPSAGTSAPCGHSTAAPAPPSESGSTPATACRPRRSPPPPCRGVGAGPGDRDPLHLSRPSAACSGRAPGRPRPTAPRPRSRHREKSARGTAGVGRRRKSPAFGGLPTRRVGGFARVQSSPGTSGTASPAPGPGVPVPRTVTVTLRTPSDSRNKSIEHSNAPGFRIRNSPS